MEGCFSVLLGPLLILHINDLNAHGTFSIFAVDTNTNRVVE